MAIFRLATPDDPMFSEGPQSYSPHWARPAKSVELTSSEKMPAEKTGSSAADIKVEQPPGKRVPKK
jgi:hypothetical protein